MFSSPSSLFKRKVASLTVFHREARKMSRGARSEFQLTPFGHFLEEDSKLVADEDVYRRLVDCYNPETDSYNVGGRWLSLQDDDINLIMGLPSCGDPVDMTNGHTAIVRGDERGTMDEALDAVTLLAKIGQARDRDDEEELTKYMVCLFFSFFLFCDGSHRTTQWQWAAVQNLYSMRRFNWARAVKDHLRLGMRAAKEDRRQGNLYGPIGGCVGILQVFLLLKFHLADPRDDPFFYYQRYSKVTGSRDMATNLRELGVNLDRLFEGQIPERERNMTDDVHVRLTNEKTQTEHPGLKIRQLVKGLAKLKRDIEALPDNFGN